MVREGTGRRDEWIQASIAPAALDATKHFRPVGNTKTIMRFTLKKKCKWKTLSRGRRKTENREVEKQNARIHLTFSASPRHSVHLPEPSFIFTSKSHELLCGCLFFLGNFFRFRCARKVLGCLFRAVSLTVFLMKSLWRRWLTSRRFYDFEPQTVFKCGLKKKEGSETFLKQRRGEKV